MIKIYYRSSKLPQERPMTNVHTIKRAMEPKPVEDGINFNQDPTQHHHRQTSEYKSLENDLIMRENEMQFSRY